ncbi:hypothetical protein Tco_0407004 [Tanacetum coccineum]
MWDRRGTPTQYKYGWFDTGNFMRILRLREVSRATARIALEFAPNADSLDYITESDLEEDPEEEDNEDPEEDPTDYPTDRDDDEEEESFRDDVDDKVEDVGGDEEEEEHLAPVDSVPPPAYRTTARMSILAKTPIPFLSEAEVDRLLAIPTPPPSSLTPLSSPLLQIASPPLPVSSPPFHIPSPLTTSPTDDGAPLGYRAARIWLKTSSLPPLPLSSPLPLPPPIILSRTRASMILIRDVTPSTYILAPRLETPPSGTPPLLPIPLPTSSPPLLLHSADCRADVLEVMLPPQKRLCISPGLRYKIGDCSSVSVARPIGGFRADYVYVGSLDAEIRHDLDWEIGYRITDVWVDPDEIVEEIPATNVAELGQRMTDFVTTIRQDTNEIYRRLDNALDDRSLMSGQLNLLHRDRHSHAHTARLLESEAKASREAWVQSIDASDTTRSHVRALWTTILACQIKIGDLQATKRRRQAQLVEALTLMRTLQT